MKVAIIGAGNVGSTLAYTLLLQDVATRVSLIDVNHEKALGEVLDLAHGASYLDNVDIRAEGYEGVADADVIVLTAGRGRKPGESRLDLARGNAGHHRGDPGRHHAALPRRRGRRRGQPDGRADLPGGEAAAGSRRPASSGRGRRSTRRASATCSARSSGSTRGTSTRT